MRPPFQPQSPKLNKALISRLTQLLTQAVDAQNKGLIQEAKSYYQQVVKLQPGNFECWHVLGIFEYQNKNYAESQRLFRKVISLQPRYAPAHCNLGLVLQDMGDVAGSILCYDQAIGLDPTLAAAYNNKGNSLKVLGNAPQALANFLSAVCFVPDYPEALYNAAEVYKSLDLWDLSLEYYNRAIQARIDYSEAFNNRGLLLQFLNRVDEAIESFNKCIEIFPSYAPAHSNKSLALLLKGDFEQGWREHEWRWKMAEFTSKQRNFTQPQWTGQHGLDGGLSGKKILIHCEQGIGDTLQFCRYLPFVFKTGAEVFVEVQDSLYSLMTQIVSPSHLIRQGEPLPEFDFHCPMISLPYAVFEFHPEIPAYEHYLKPSESTKMRWSHRLGIQRKKRIGWVWSGNQFHHNDAYRSLPLQTLKPFIKLLENEFEQFSLQKDLRPGEQEILNDTPGMLTLSQSIEDFEDTAALCALMDIVITVDTSVAHLSGSLGRPTWLMLPFAPDWRWMLNRSDSPWYPSFKLFRQKAISDWPSVLRCVCAELEKHV